MLGSGSQSFIWLLWARRLRILISIVLSMLTYTSTVSQVVTYTLRGLCAVRPSCSSSSNRLGCPAAGNVASRAAVEAAR